MQWSLAPKRDALKVSDNLYWSSLRQGNAESLTCERYQTQDKRAQAIGCTDLLAGDLAPQASIDDLLERNDVYFCDPRSPWQRVPNENTNGLLRHSFAMLTDLPLYSQA